MSKLKKKIVSVKIKSIPKPKKIVKPKKEKVDRYYEKLFTKCKREWSFHSPIKKECANLAREQVGTAFKWWCNHCNDKFAWSEIAFDHIKPIGNTTPRTLEEFLECVRKQNCPLNNLQVLCKNCHKIKTSAEVCSKDKLLFISNCEKWLSAWEFPFNLDKLEFKHLKRLNSLIGKINTVEDSKKKQDWRKKLLEFIKKHG